MLTDPEAFEGASVTTPRWLGEGMAVLLDELALSEYDYDTPAYTRTHTRTQPGYLSRIAAEALPLGEVETWPSGFAGSVAIDGNEAKGRTIIECIYVCGYYAVELLASRVGLSKLAYFYMYLEPWMMPPGGSEDKLPRPGWRLAFERAYGMTVEEFYELFEKHRADGFPRSRYLNS